MFKKPTVIDSIKPGEEFNHKGALIVLNDIGAGATVNVTSGGLTVCGDIHDGASATVEASKFLGTSVAFNLYIGTKNKNQADTGSILVMGRTGDRVALKSIWDISLNQAGNNLVVDAGENFSAHGIGENAQIEAEGKVRISSQDYKIG